MYPLCLDVNPTRSDVMVVIFSKFVQWLPRPLLKKSVVYFLNRDEKVVKELSGSRKIAPVFNPIAIHFK